MKVEKLKNYCKYDNGDYSFCNKEGFYCLIRNSIDVLEGKKVISLTTVSDGEYRYETINRAVYSLIDEEILEKRRNNFIYAEIYNIAIDNENRRNSKSA